jgi:predicted Fe-Mo cluster-binding NifX family protein
MEKIAIPMAAGSYCPHFGGADAFMLCDADAAAGKIEETHVYPAPEHKPGALPRWLHQQGVDTVLAGRMGSRAQQMLSRLGMKVVAGVAGPDPRSLIRSYLDGTLVQGDGSCDGTGHGHGRGHGAGGCGGGGGRGRRGAVR